MKKVYVVTSGSYSDYRIAGIFTTNELAEGYKKMFEDRYSDFNDTEEWDLDTFKTDIELGYTCFEIQMKINGDVLYINKSNCYYTDINYVPTDNRFYGQVFAKDETHAIKIFNEKRIQYKQIHNI